MDKQLTLIKYYFGGSHSEYKFGSWFGPYTVGDISIRGTRLWFRPSNSKTQMCFDVDLWNEDSDVCYEEFLPSINNPDSEELPSDTFNYRSESLEEIIKELKGELEVADGLKHFKGDFKQFSDFLYEEEAFESWNQIKSVDLPNHSILYTLDYRSIWFIESMEKVVAELEEVFKECTKEGVTWIWV